MKDKKCKKCTICDGFSNLKEPNEVILFMEENGCSARDIQHRLREQKLRFDNTRTAKHIGLIKEN